MIHRRKKNIFTLRKRHMWAFLSTSESLLAIEIEWALSILATGHNMFLFSSCNFMHWSSACVCFHAGYLKAVSLFVFFCSRAIYVREQKNFMNHTTNEVKIPHNHLRYNDRAQMKLGKISLIRRNYLWIFKLTIEINGIYSVQFIKFIAFSLSFLWSLSEFWP